MRIANCTTAAQYFHLLRWQAALLQRHTRPLVVMAPKSLLRLPEAASSLEALATGKFHPVLDDEDARQRADEVTRLILCTGKVYYDLLAYAARQAGRQVAIARVELLYPFPAADLAALLNAYPGVREVVWAQEEPQNMGAWSYIAPRLHELTGDSIRIEYVGRPPRASPAEGLAEWHAVQQARIVEAAFKEVLTLEKTTRGTKRGD